MHIRPLMRVSLFILMLATVLARHSWAEELPALASTAKLLEEQSALNPDVQREESETPELPKAAPGQRNALLAITTNPQRKPFERIAALALAGSLADPEREKEVRAVFEGLVRGMAPRHVHPSERYVSHFAPTELRQAKGKSNPHLFTPSNRSTIESRRSSGRGSPRWPGRIRLPQNCSSKVSPKTNRKIFANTPARLYRNGTSSLPCSTRLTFCAPAYTA